MENKYTHHLELLTNLWDLMNIDIHKIATYLNEYKDNIKYSWQFDSEPFKKLLPMDSSYPDKTSDLEANIAFKEFVYTHLPSYISVE